MVFHTSTGCIRLTQISIFHHYFKCTEHCMNFNKQTLFLKGNLFSEGVPLLKSAVSQSRSGHVFQNKIRWKIWFLKQILETLNTFQTNFISLIVDIYHLYLYIIHYAKRAIRIMVLTIIAMIDSNYKQKIFTIEKISQNICKSFQLDGNTSILIVHYSVTASEPIVRVFLH